MNDRPTPETNRIMENFHIAMHADSYEQSIAHSEEAHREVERLERERDEALDAAEKAKSYKRVLKQDNAKLRRDLDKAQRDADTFLENFGKTQERAINAERELDELNKRLIEVCQYGVVCTIEREDLRKEVAAERALADRLANAVACLSAETTQGYEHIQSAFDAWKEARK